MEIVFEIKAKHGYIYKYLQQNNLTIKELSERIGVPYSTLISIINFRWVPSKRRRSLKIKSVSERLEEFFHMPIEFLFPKELVPEIMERLGKKRTIVHELDLVSLNDVDQKYLTYTMDSQIETSSFYEELYKLLPTLLPREEQCLRLRWGLRDDCDNRTEIIAKCKRQRGEVITVRKVRNPSRRKIYKPIVKEVV